MTPASAVSPDQQDPVVTVVVPSYESGRTVRDTVESLLAQTWRDLEVLVVDDGSRRDAVPEDLPRDHRLRVDRLPQNRGYAGVTNHALERARGEWICFVDADDVVGPRYLETMLAAGERHRADTVLAPLMCVRDGVETGTLTWDPPGEVSGREEAMRRLLSDRIAGSQHVLLRRPSVRSAEERTFSDWIFLLRHLAVSGTVAYVPEPLYRYTIHAGSVTGSLRESAWELADLAEEVSPQVRAVFPPSEAEHLLESARRTALTQLLHKAARAREESVLRTRITAYCRTRITLRGVRELWAEGRRVTAVSWALARCSPRLHRRMYQLYDTAKG